MREVHARGKTGRANTYNATMQRVAPFLAPFLKERLYAHRAYAAAVAIIAAFATPVSSEAPPRDLDGEMVVTRFAFFKDGFGEQVRYGGIWRLNPATWEYTRLRPFLSTFGITNSTSPGPVGLEGVLSAHDDTITWRTWPGTLEFDLLSWRLIRRLPTTTPAEAPGWIVHGPTVSSRDATALGLPGGTYGFERCMLQYLASGYGWPPPRECNPSPFPQSTTDELNTALLFESPEPGHNEIVLLIELPPPGFVNQFWPPTTLAPDYGRRGLWRALPQGCELLPVTSTGLGSTGTTVDFDLSIFDMETVEIRNLHYHPPTDTLYGVAYDAGHPSQGSWVFQADPTSGEATEIASSDDSYAEGTPTTWASIGRPPNEHVQLVPIIGGGPGRHGTNWTTDVWLYNPSDQALSAHLRRVTQPDQVRHVEIGPHASVRIEDTLTWLGAGSTGDGTSHEAVVVTSPERWAEQLVVFGRISTADPATGGRFGHALPAVPGRIGYSNHTPYRGRTQAGLEFVGSTALNGASFILDLGEPGRYRANIGMVNDENEAIQLALHWGASMRGKDLYTTNWPDAARIQLTVPPHSVLLRPLRDLFPPEIHDSFPPTIAVLGDHPAALWVSIIDNRTGDATFVPFTVFQMFNDDEDDRLVIPAVARNTGVNSSVWRTDLIGPMAYFIDFNVAYAHYQPSNQAEDCGGAAQFQDIAGALNGELGMPEATWIDTLSGVVGHPVGWHDAVNGYLNVFHDIIGRFPECAGDTDTRGALEVAVGNWTAGYSRTYTTRPDGGTYGSMLPFYPPRGWPVQHFAGLIVSDEQRINLGLYNGLDQPVTHQLLLYAADGTLAATTELALAAHEHRQELLQVFLGALPDGLYGLTVVPLDDPAHGVEGRSWAYVSIVDNRTNDPINLW